MTVKTERAGPVTVLTLARPDARNAVDAPTARQLAAAIDEFGADDEARVLIVTGAGSVAFCAGADLKGVDALMSHPRTVDAGPMGFAALDPGKPTIAAIDGYCFAGGMELAAWCDFRIAGEQSEFGALNRRWGVPFFDGGTYRLPAAMGTGNALWLMETGIRINARQAKEIGLVQEVVPPGEALSRAMTLAQEMAAYPQTRLRADRMAVLSASGRTFSQGLAAEREICRAAVDQDDMRQRLAEFAHGSRPPSPRPLD
ncbi:MAG TPA: enoyl-CoA hydratase-related protein [Acidimicrobiia bacterium]|nr:enoyl-CoA hydratase-related protein [Acidimicrobiia bacterium]